MTRQVDTARDVTWVCLLGLVEQTVSNQHRHYVTTLGLVKDVTVSLEQGLCQLDDSH